MAKTSEAKETPLMKQYNEVKAKYPGALLLFRVGDFYETFGEDAIKASEILGIVLTRRANGSASHIELAGFPHHSLDTYLPKLVRAGQRVAICDQLEDPKMTKTIVKRGVTEVITPGVSYNDNIINHKSNNYLAAVYFSADKNENAGVSFLDISTGEFFVAEGDKDHIDKLLQSFSPSEILFQRGKIKDIQQAFGDKFYSYALDEWIFGYEYAYENLTKHFITKSLKGFGIENLKLAICAAGASLHYLYDTQHKNLQHITSISRIEEDQYVWLDRFTMRNLELVYSPNDNAVPLINILDKTSSAMGARLLRKWLLLPLKDKKRIEERHEVVQYFLDETTVQQSLLNELKQIGDLERLISKVALQKVNPREIAQLSRSLKSIEAIKNICENSGHDQLKIFGDQLNPCKVLTTKIDKELHPDPPALLVKGNVIAMGVSDELDELRKISFGGKDYLLEIQKREVEVTGISSLKVAFNNVFGYYLEVTHAHKEKVPDSWIRKQTLVNAERYITPELKEYEEKILGAEEKIAALENKLYHELVIGISEYLKPIQLNTGIIAQLDVLLSFALIASKNNYVKPQLSDDHTIDIKNGRHPVIEQRLPIGEEYIPNDVFLDNENQQIIIITGPNMSGKSAILRQTGLIVLLAQIGSFVPAAKANIGIVDKIFTRVGASDNISSGESTFMVEMNETASILNNLSDRSLVLLDEIGRGTSTYDGISIAWAIAEFIHQHPKAKAKTLFATHYHELNEMAAQMERIKNYNVSIKEIDNKIIFLRKLIPGGSEHSFGIHVAKMAGMPALVVGRANEILKRLEEDRSTGNGHAKLDHKKWKKNNEMQLNIFSLDDPVLIKIRDSLQNLDVNTLTPVEALMKLDEVQRLLKN
jgi:DNA mismatch repair protein MutS